MKESFHYHASGLILVGLFEECFGEPISFNLGSNMKSILNIAAMLEEIAKISFKVDGTGIEMAYAQSQRINWKVLPPHLSSAIYEISTHRDAAVLYFMINIMPAGSSAPKHTDTLALHEIFGKAPKLERWHLPIKTNEKALWWDATDGSRHLELGKWHGPMKYWESHAVQNNGDEPRIHLIVDLDRQFTGDNNSWER